MTRVTHKTIIARTQAVLRNKGLSPLLYSLQSIGEIGVLGGLPRDMVHQTPRQFTRDIDLCVRTNSPERLDDLIMGLDPAIQALRTSLGGYRLNYYGTQVDVWALSSTWALRDHNIEDLNFWDLILTTYHNWDSGCCVVGRVRKTGTGYQIRTGVLICDSDWLESVRTKYLDLSNQGHTPNPLKCLTKTLRHLTNPEVRIAKRLAQHTLWLSDQYGIGEILLKESQIYPDPRLNKEVIERLLCDLRDVG